MELSAVNEETEATGGNRNVLYENTRVDSVILTVSQKVQQAEEDLQHYEPLRLDTKPETKVDSRENQSEKSENKDTLKRLKCVICVMSVMLIILYIGVIVMVVIIALPKAKIDGKWTQWSDWTPCDVTCGNGTQIRTRSCSDPSPINGGADCNGERAQINKCTKSSCQVTDGGWTNWEDWSACSLTCGGGIQSRSRSCTNPRPSDGGEYCTGDTLQIQQCNLKKCAHHTSAFSVDKPSSYTNVNAVYKLTFSHTIYQHGGDFNSSTGTYTCSIPGTYYFAVTLVKKRANVRVDRVYCQLYKSRSDVINIHIDPTDDETDKGSAAISQGVIIHLNNRDTVYLGSCNGQPSTYMEDWTLFTGFLVDLDF